MFEAIMSASVLLKVLCTLGLILLLNTVTKQLAVSVFVGAVLLGLWTGHSSGGLMGVAAERSFSVDNLLLIVIIFEVIWLSSQMSRTGLMEDLVDSVRSRVSREGAMAALPAVIGFLPMPGGALFSAPLVDSCDEGEDVSRSLKARANHWFRHVWEYWWPLYPGVLLAMSIIEFDVWQMMIMGVPLTLAAIGAGYFFILRPISHHEETARAPERGGERPSLTGPLMPIIVVVLTYVMVRAGYTGIRSWSAGLPPLNRYVPMMAGLVLAMILLQVAKPLGARDWKEIVFSRRTLNMVVIVLAVRIYGAFIEADLPDGTPLVAKMRAEMDQWGIPLLAMTMLLPMISGLATGVSIGFVGASFPIVLKLWPDAASNQLLAVVALAYGFGYMGMLLSPVHVCLIVTCEHFKVEVSRAIRGMLRPAILVLLCSVGLYLFWNWFPWQMWERKEEPKSKRKMRYKEEVEWGIEQSEVQKMPGDESVAWFKTPDSATRTVSRSDACSAEKTSWHPGSPPLILSPKIREAPPCHLA
ncbi:MAG: DUF401 family protein [Candidatus Brocadiia bacterium]